MRVPAFFASMLRERAICVGLFGAAIILVTANMLGWSIWPCTFHEMTGRPCPACGLTRGMSALVRGDVGHALHFNLFTPVFALGAAVMLMVNLLPDPTRMRVVTVIDRLERKTAITWLLLFAFIGYGAWRIFALPQWPG